MRTQFFNLRRRTHSSLRWLPALLLSSALTPLLPLTATPTYAAGRANNPAIQADARRQPITHLAGAVCDGSAITGDACATLASPQISLLDELKCPEGYAPIGGTCVRIVPQSSLLGELKCPEGYAPIGGTCVRIVPQSSLLGDVRCAGYAPIGGTCVGTGTREDGLPGEVGCEGYAPIGGTSICDTRLSSIGTSSNNG
ncbi:MAG TPA: hypothetical protein VGD58_08350 [Herpetosiphonaceae bacterium]